MRTAWPLLVAAISVGCGSPAPRSVVGTWQAFQGTGSAAKLYYGRPAPTEVEFRSDGTYSMHLMWGARSIAQTFGTYEVHGDTIHLMPKEQLDRTIWPGALDAELSPSRRAFTLRMPKGYRVTEARFVQQR